MLVEEKYFPHDKNYLLKTVQAFAKERLLTIWLDEILAAYNHQHNPMGLEDDFVIELREKIGIGTDLLEELYDILAGIYRYDHGDNQLEFQWDGRTHMEVYDTDWRAMYLHWIRELSLIKEIQRPIVRYAVSGKMVNTEFLKQSLRKGILTYFQIRLRSQTLYRVSA